MLGHPLPITAAGHSENPVSVIQIPKHCFSNSALEGFSRTPLQFALNLAGIHRIPAIMTGTVFDKCYELSMRHHGVIRPQFVEKLANGADYFQIIFFTAATYIVSFAHAPFCKYSADRVAVIFYIKPVANVFSITVYRKRFALAPIENHQWN